MNDEASVNKTSDFRAEFIASLSHEIRTPITAVLGMNEAILRESKESNIINYATEVDKAGRLLLALVNDILDYSRLGAGKIKMLVDEYSLKKLIISCNNIVKSRAEEKNLNLILDIDETLPLKLKGDEIRLQQIILNLLTNAIKYTKRGSVTLKVFDKTIDDDFTMLNIHVIDTGIGIKEEDKDKLFTAFERVDEENNKHIEGTGLGLSITSRFIEMMGGTIEVESEYGKGSVFKVAIPQEVCSMETIGIITINETEEHTKNDAVVNFQAPNARILVVDDNVTNLKVVMSILSNTKIRVECAKSGNDAISMAENRKYNIIFMDHFMPDLDGIETMKEIKKLENNPNEDTPFIMMTANANEGAREEYLSFGFDDYISKPFRTKEIQRILSEYIAI